MKIVSLLPSTTEICYALGLGDALVGVTHECDFPVGALAKPKLTANVLPEGPHSSADIDRMISERVLSGQSIYHLDTGLLTELAPDLILTQELCEVCAVSYTDVLAAAQALPKVPEVAAFEPHTIEEILASIGEVARLAGVRERGEEVVAALRSRLAAVAERTGDRPAPSVLCLEWLSPPMVGGHWVPEMVRLAGGVDVLGPEGQPSTYVTWEQIAVADSDVIIVMPCGYDLPATCVAMRELNDIPAWHTLRAVREGRVYPVDGSSYFNRPGPRVVDGVELLARLIHQAAVPAS
ncbi:MAG TPA: cobalamin-binding protein [Thermomicrobiales bacterium]|nr:cobalamin-binding protein [Thermomicrobiales bacterium]